MENGLRFRLPVTAGALINCIGETVHPDRGQQTLIGDFNVMAEIVLSKGLLIALYSPHFWTQIQMI
jgi:hypothetical protein